MESQNGSLNLNIDNVLYTGNNTIPTLPPDDGIDTVVLLNGDKYNWNGTAWVNDYVRLAIPTAPVITVGGTGFVKVSQTTNWSTSDHKNVYFGLTMQVTQTASNAWNFFTVPNIAGFQRAQVTPTASYRYTGNPLNDSVGQIDQVMPPPPFMGIEWSAYFNGTCYMNVPNRTQAVGYYISLIVKYIKS